MGKSAPAPQAQQVTTQTSNLPEYARPYFENVVNRAMAQSYQPYQRFEAPRLAGFTPAQEQVQQNILGMQGPRQFAAGSAMAQQAGLGALNQQGYNPSQFNAGQVQAPSLQQFQMERPDMFGQPQAEQYMSPYMRSVLDVQKREAVNDARQSQILQDLGAARQGTYGGSRQLLAGLQRERALGQQLGDIEARGMQSAFENAQQQFERDRTAGMSAAGQNLAARLQTQGLGAQTGLQAALANQQMGLEGQRLGEMSRQFGAQQGLAGLQLAGQMGQTLGNLGQFQQQADLQRLGAQGAAAGEQRALQQQALDMQYADFLRQRDYQMEQLGYFSNILRGLPVGLSTTQTAYATPPSLSSQLVGGGLGALSMANLMRP
jgi:hypothetical protein